MVAQSSLTISFGTINYHHVLEGAPSVMVIVVGNGLGDTSSNPRRDWLDFT